MKKALFWLFGILIVVCGGGGYLFMQGQQAKKDAEAKAKLAQQVEVKRDDILVQVVDTGVIDAELAVEVKSRVSGRLESLLVKEGDRVTKGQLVAILDPIEYGFAMRQGSAQTAAAKSSLGRAGVELEQRRKTAYIAVERARSAVASVEKELKAQPALTRAAIRSAEASLQQARSALTQLETITQPTERVAALTSVDEAKSTTETAKRELDRRTLLLQKGYVAEAEVDSARQSYEAANARFRLAEEKLRRLADQQKMELEQSRERVEIAQSELDRAQTNAVQDGIKKEQYRTALANLRDAEAGLRDIDALRFGREQSRANYDQLSASLDQSRWYLQQTRIYAPLTGTVTRRYTQQGELVTGLSNFSTGTPIIRIEDRASLLVKLDINEIDVAKIVLGMKAGIVVDALPNESFTGTVTKIAPTSSNLQSVANAQAGTASDSVVKFEVEILLANPSPRIRSGMNAKCTLNVIRREGVLAVPIEYVGKDEKGYFVEKADGKPGVQTRVKVGEASGSKIEIKDGVAAGTMLRRPQYKGPDRKGMMSTSSN